MRLSRTAMVRISYALNELLPPALRDSGWFMRPLIRLVFREHAELVMTFKQDVSEMTDAEIADVYRVLAPYFLTCETDLNPPCMARVLAELVGSSVLEVGCGEGALAEAMSRTKTVVACDIVVRPELATRAPKVTFREANIEALPFNDAQFDTVVCTHTLEHLREVRVAMDELRRVARRRVIVVVPKERSYRYTFNLHLHFFPYHYAFRSALGPARGIVVASEVVGGDWYHVEDIDRTVAPGDPSYVDTT